MEVAKVVIFGAGQGADMVYRYLSRDTEHQICGFTVDAPFFREPSLRGLPVVDYATVTARFPPDEYRMFVALGFQRMNRVRADKYLDAKGKGYGFVSYVNSRHYSLEGISVGENCLILDNTIFNLDVSIGDNVTIWSGCHLGDRTAVGNHVWMASHATLSGDVTVGEYCFLGVNCSVSNHVALGAATFVGANVLVSQSTEPDSVYVAPAARKLPVTSDQFMAMVNLT
jgi:sugar O-acyltransferase (sialic acid O-acetyltransferase NeuD family)